MLFVSLVHHVLLYLFVEHFEKQSPRRINEPFILA